MKENLYVENRALVVPGDKIAEGDYLLGEGTFRDGEAVYANVLGLVDIKEKFVKVIPLSGKYVPNVRDLVIGVITDIAYSSWYVDINSPYQGVLPVATATERFIDVNEEDLSKIYDIGDVILAKVVNVSQTMIVGLTMKDRGLFKLREGRLITISPTKVPRVIGKKGTMVQMLKELTGCKITVGQNGRVWINGTDPNLAIEAIRLIEKEAHTSGLTDKVKQFLESKTNRKLATISTLKKERAKEEKTQVEQKEEAKKPLIKPTVTVIKKVEKKEKVN